MNKNGLVCLLLLAAMTFTACSQSDADKNNDATVSDDAGITTSAQAETAADETQMWEYIDDEIPANNFDGAAVNILSTDY